MNATPNQRGSVGLGRREAVPGAMPQPTVGGAARALQVDASTVSRRLATLEEVLATSLFDRGRDGIAPTEAAEALLPVAEEVEQGMARFGNLAQGLERKPPAWCASPVRPTSPRSCWHRCSRAARQAPEAAHRARSGRGRARSHPTRSRLGAAHRATQRGRPGDDAAHECALGTGGRAPSWRGAWGVVRDFARRAVGGLGRALGRHRAPRAGCAKHVKHAEPVVRSDSLTVQLAAVASGVGVALVPEPSVRHYGLTPVKMAPQLTERRRGMASGRAIPGDAPGAAQRAARARGVGAGCSSAGASGAPRTSS